MSTSNYTLEIVSHHPQFKNKNLRQYYVDGINTVGAWGDEPFEIRFRNNTFQKLQVKLSLDGTDILTGAPATTDANKNMWVVNGYGTLTLKAWPETNNGGASFIFTSTNNSVAAHTHGDMSSRGIIAAAVYVEGHVQTVCFPRIEPYYHNWDLAYPNYIGGATFSSNSTSSGNYDLSEPIVASNSINTNFNREVKSLESLASVGAGQHVDQKITYVNGLIKPTFTETIRVKYLWWDELQSKLRENNVPAPHASGFPGDKNQNIMSLGNTPRINGSFHRSESGVVNYSRV